MKDLSPELINAFENHATLERWGHDMYMAIGKRLKAANWAGFSRWFMERAHEENSTADDIMDYLIRRKADPDYGEVNAPEIPSGPEILEYFQKGFEVQLVHTAGWEAVHDVCEGCGDKPACLFVEQYLMSQVDDEYRFYDAVRRIGLADGDVAALLKLDHDFGKK